MEFRKTVPGSIRVNMEVLTLSKTLVKNDGDQEDYEQIEDEIHLTFGVIIFMGRQ